MRGSAVEIAYAKALYEEFRARALYKKIYAKILTLGRYEKRLIKRTCKTFDARSF